jgi:hypothetical protein
MTTPTNCGAPNYRYNMLLYVRDDMIGTLPETI